MGWLFLGLCVLLALLVAGRLLLTANPADLARWLRWIGFGVVGVVAVFLLVTGRFGFGIPLALLAFGLLRRWSLPSLGPSTFGGASQSGGSSGQSSEVTTDYLRMTLEHASGLMRGAVLKGPLAGADLADLDRDQLMQLLADCRRDDPSSAQLLESYLDRAFGDEWRGAGGQREAPPPPPGGAMSREEALEILGLAAGASAEEVRAAYRTLMQKLHPDQGGSTYLAAKINQAKDTLLRS